MNSKTALAVMCALAGVSPAFADTTVNFDNAPKGADVGNFYPGVTFGAGEQAFSQVLPLFPAHSGTQDLSVSSLNSTPNLTFSFTTPVTELSFWYATGFAFTADRPPGIIF